MITIRQATMDDAPALAQLRWEFSLSQPILDYPLFAARFTAFLSEALVGGRWVIWVAGQDDQLVANIYVHLIEQVPRADQPDKYVGWISNVYTRPEYRNQGVGSRLMEHVIEWAKGQPFESLNLWHSERSAPYYERLGFTHATDEFLLMLDGD